MVKVTHMLLSFAFIKLKFFFLYIYYSTNSERTLQDALISPNIYLFVSFKYYHH